MSCLSTRFELNQRDPIQENHSTNEINIPRSSWPYMYRTTETRKHNVPLCNSCCASVLRYSSSTEPPLMRDDLSSLNTVPLISLIRSVLFCRAVPKSKLAVKRTIELASSLRKCGTLSLTRLIVSVDLKGNNGFADPPAFSCFWAIGEFSHFPTENTTAD